MRRRIVAVVLLLPVLAACKGTSGGSPDATPNPQLSEAQAVVQRCVASTTLLTKAGRQSFYKCVAPPGQQAVVQDCLGKALARDGVLTKAARKKFQNDAAGCVLAAQKKKGTTK